MSLDNNNNNYKAIIAAPSKSLRSRLHEGILDFCERMADIEAGRRNQYGGIPQQLHDAEDERRRLRKEAQKAKEQGYQKNSNDDAGGEEHDDNTDADKVDDHRKKDKATNIYGVDNDKTTMHNHKLRKDKAADKGVVHDIQKLQKRPPGHGKPALMGGKTPTEPKEGFQQMNESSSDEELQWITDRMMLGDLDKVPVVLGHPKTETPKSLNATEEPVLRLRGGAGGAGGKHRQRAYDDDDDDSDDDHDHYSDDDDDDEDYRNALLESVKGIPRDIPKGNPRGILRYQLLDREERVNFADEPDRYVPFSYNPHAGSSLKYGFGGGTRNPTSDDQNSRSESSKYGGSKGAGGRHRQRAYDDDDDDDDEDYRNALLESVKGIPRDIPRDIPRGIPRGILRDRSPDQEKRVHFADEPHRYAPFSYNPHAGSSPEYGFGGGARNPKSADQGSRSESSNYGGSKGSLHFGPSSGYNSKENEGAGFGFSRGVRGVDFGESSSSKNDGGKRGAGVKYLIVDSSDEEGVESGRSSREKNKGENYRRRRPRSPSSSPRPTRTRNHGKSHGKSRKRSSKVAQETDSSSHSDEDRSNFSDEEESESSFKSAKVIKTPPPDHYAVLGLTHDCSAQEITEAAKRMRIKTHPDKLKKVDMSAKEKAKIDETAANIGQAAELLSDPEKRREYDRLVRKWEIKHEI
ncbi:hypothetical protein MMC29_006644 [Sticta canariensis]|nr:hypothetical protein [Sticta canariensis]